jgi:hypothetical protein
LGQGTVGNVSPLRPVILEEGTMSDTAVTKSSTLVGGDQTWSSRLRENIIVGLNLPFQASKIVKFGGQIVSGGNRKEKEKDSGMGKVREWWEHTKEYNIATRCGADSNSDIVAKSGLSAS